jgi:hypothetical protein
LLDAQLAEAAGPTPVSVHPNLAEAYRRRVSALEKLLDDAELRDEAIEAIRSMIDRIVVTPRGGGGVSLVLHSNLPRILALCSESTKAPSPGEMGLSLSVVAGARITPTHRLPPMVVRVCSR